MRWTSEISVEEWNLFYRFPDELLREYSGLEPSQNGWFPVLLLVVLVIIFGGVLLRQYSRKNVMQRFYQ